MATSPSLMADQPSQPARPVSSTRPTSSSPPSSASSFDGQPTTPRNGEDAYDSAPAPHSEYHGQRCVVRWCGPRSTFGGAGRLIRFCLFPLSTCVTTTPAPHAHDHLKPPFRVCLRLLVPYGCAKADMTIVIKYPISPSIWLNAHVDTKTMRTARSTRVNFATPRSTSLARIKTRTERKQMKSSSSATLGEANPTIVIADIQTTTKTTKLDRND